MRRIQFLFLPLLLFLLHSCSDGARTPLDLGDGPDSPKPSGGDRVIDFERFGPGDTITAVDEVGISLPVRGARCADALIAFDSSVPHGAGDDDLDLGTPNETFGGPGVGEGGERDQPFQNDRPLGMLLIIQEDPGYPDGNPDPQDDCQDGGTIAFDFSLSSADGVVLTSVTVVDVDDQEMADGTTFRLFGPGSELLGVMHPPATGQNGVASMSLGPTSGVVSLEVEMIKSVAIDRISFTVPDDSD